VNRTRILVADRMTIFRSGVRNLLVRDSDLEVVEAADLDGVRRVITNECPDIALVDLDLPPVGGVAAVSWLRECCRARVVVWSFDPTSQSVLAAVRAGASGFLHKDISAQGLLRALRGVVRGEGALSRELVTLMIDEIHRHEERQRALARLAVLSSREREILDFVAQGERNRDIARHLTISEFTVKRHIQNILGKLDVASRAAAAEYYVKAETQLPAAGTAT
jgi:two-component system, NarL family, nitrate/nitrite response regulator NarL